MTNRKKLARPGFILQERLLEFDDYNYTQLNRELDKGINKKTSSMMIGIGGNKKIKSGLNLDRMRSIRDSGRDDYIDDQTLDMNEDISALIELTEEGDLGNQPEISIDM